MGEKVAARNAMKSRRVPILPGVQARLNHRRKPTKLANEIGYPVIVKASGGGGGRGMRIVHAESELAHALETASTEAAAAFKNGDVYIERYVEKTSAHRIQVLADETRRLRISWGA
jgi:acetyl-CoA carboxylase biotin carboxylase subunit